MSDTTTARRALLGLLLDRVERGALLDSERPLLRPLVLAEQGAADARDTALAPAADALYETAAMLTHIGSGTWVEAIECVEARAMAYDRSGGRALALAGRIVSSEAAWQAALDKANAETARRERQYTAEFTRADRAEATVYRLRQTTREAAATALPGSELDRFVEQMAAILDTPSDTDPAPDDGQPTTDDAPQTSVWKGPAEGYGTGQMIGLLAMVADGLPTDIKQWGPGDYPNPPEGQGVQRCSPLVNAACPGHTAPPYCDREPSSPVTTPTDQSDLEFVHTNDIPLDWAKPTELRCPAHYIGPPPQLANQLATADYVCELRVHSRGADHAARLGDELFSWADDIAIYPTTDAPSAQQE